MNRGEVVRYWRQRLDEALDASGVPTVEELPAPPVIDRLALFHTGSECVASAMDPDPHRFDADGFFIEAVFTATREVALVALRTLPDEMPAYEMVESVLRGRDALRAGVAAWVGQLDHAGIAALAAAAVSWIVDARALGARRGEPDWQLPRGLDHAPSGRGVVLTATVDAVRRSSGGPHLLVVRPTSTSTDRRVAARVALAWVLVRAEVPSSVVLGIRNSLQRVRFEVDRSFLDEAVGWAVDDIAHAQRPSLAPRHPGPYCRWCSIADGCAQGCAWLERARVHPFARAHGPRDVHASSELTSGVAAEPTM